MNHSLSFSPIKTMKSAQIVAERLRGAIVAGDLAMGGSLPVERELIESFAVSRTTMREAMRILETEGLLEIARGAKGGARVVGPTLALAAHAVGMVLQAQGTQLSDVQIARQVIEPPAARMVAERRDPEDLVRLKEVLNQERAQIDAAEFPFAAMRFHETLVQLSGNRTLSAFLLVLHEIHEGVAVALSRYPSDADLRASRERFLGYHERLIALIEAGDGAAAEAHWREYWNLFTPPHGLVGGGAVVDVLGQWERRPPAADRNGGAANPPLASPRAETTSLGIGGNGE